MLITMEVTLSLLKPHLVKNPLATENIKKLIIKQGFIFLESKKISLKKEEAEMFYGEHKDKFFFDRLITFICSGPIDASILASENAIQKWRSVLGPTKVFKAIHSDPGSIRGMYGLSDTRNAAHGSDSKESAEREIKMLFPDFSLKNWQQKLLVKN